jgi:hypothetical protein
MADTFSMDEAYGKPPKAPEGGEIFSMDEAYGGDTLTRANKPTTLQTVAKAAEPFLRPLVRTSEELSRSGTELVEGTKRVAASGKRLAASGKRLVQEIWGNTSYTPAPPMTPLTERTAWMGPNDPRGGVAEVYGGFNPPPNPSALRQFGGAFGEAALQTVGALGETALRTVGAAFGMDAAQAGLQGIFLEPLQHAGVLVPKNLDQAGLREAAGLMVGVSPVAGASAAVRKAAGPVSKLLLGIGDETKALPSGIANRATYPKPDLAGLASEQLAEKARAADLAAEMVRRNEAEAVRRGRTTPIQAQIADATGIARQEAAAAEVKRRRKAITEAFESDKDYADYVKGRVEAQMGMQAAREELEIGQASRGAEYTPPRSYVELNDIVNKPGFLRTPMETLALERHNSVWRLGESKDLPGSAAVTLAPRGPAFDLAALERVGASAAGGIAGAISDPEHPLQGAVAGMLMGMVGGKRVGLVAGERAKGADIPALTRARLLLARGRGDQTVPETGWFKDVDGKWKFEIDDSAAKLKQDKLIEVFDPKNAPTGKYMLPIGGKLKLADVLEHPQLFRAYPELRDVDVKPLLFSASSSGDYNELTRMMRLADAVPENLLSTILHETQHAIQGVEGFARGGSSALFIPETFAAEKKLNNEVIRDLRDYFRKTYKGINSFDISTGLLQQWGGVKLLKTQQAAVDAVRQDPMAREFLSELLKKDSFHAMDVHAYEAYRRLAGEAEARAVQKRQMLTAAERREQPFPADAEREVPARQRMISWSIEGEANAVKKPGGNWHPEAVERLANSIATVVAEDLGQFRNRALNTWARNRVSKYLNKYAGTSRDPLKDVEIPFGEGTKRWEEVTDAAISARPAADLAAQIKEAESSGFGLVQRDLVNRELVKNAKPGESIWDVYTQGAPVTADGPVAALQRGQEGLKARAALTSYLSHVGDFLRQNADPAKLGQYDLVRAVRETAANDARVAKEMEKAAAQSTKDLPVYKDYGDGFKWVELKLPEKLTEEQAKRVREATPKEISWNVTPEQEAKGTPPKYTALDSSGKPIKNSYTEEIAVGRTPEEAHLFGQLAEEGHTMGHCVGGYCEDVASGATRILSLRDAKGRSHATVEVEPGGDVRRYSPREWFDNLASADVRQRLGEEPYATNFIQKSEARVLQEQREWAQRVMAEPAYKDWLASRPESITQIKGKQNRAPNAEYLPYVQDLVKSGKWGEVGDLGNTGLARHPDTGEFVPVESLGAAKGRWQEDVLRRADEPPEDWNPQPRGGNQAGFADIPMLARIATTGIGAAAGAALDPEHPISGAIKGGMAAVLLNAVPWRALPQVWRDLSAPGKLVKIDDLLKSHQGNVAAATRSVMQFSNAIREAVPDTTLRRTIADFIERDRIGDLPGPAQAAARRFTEFTEGFREKGLSAGVLKDALNNYVTHIWGSKGLSLLDKILSDQVGGGAGTSSRFALTRKLQGTLNEVAAREGLTPLTTDIADIAEIYGKSMLKAMENSKFIAALREAKLADGDLRLVVKEGAKGTDDYRLIDHPQMKGLKVHPDIEAPLRFIFDTNNPHAAIKGLEAVNTLQKRMAVSFSLFHAKALEDAMLGAQRLFYAPGTVVKSLAQAALPRVFGENVFVRQLMAGGEGDIVDRGLRAGLGISYQRANPALEELSAGFYEGLGAAQRVLDHSIPGAGNLVKGFAAANHAFDNFMWGRLHAGLKLQLFADKVAEMELNNAKAFAKNPEKYPLIPREKIDEMAASFVNDIFGGLNWQRLALEPATRWGRTLAQIAYSPSGRRLMRLALFAPDWTISTSRAFLKASGSRALGYEPGTGVRGLFSPQTTADLHRQYLIRSAFWYAVIGDALNYAFTGKPIWENKDPTRIDFGDGRTMQWSKHTMEPVHWLTEPLKQGINKLGYIPKEMLNQLFGTEYLAPHEDRTGSVVAGPKMKSGRLVHAAKGFSPIGITQQIEAGDTASGLSGMAGVPIYGKTREQREQDRYQRMLERRQKR